MQKIRKILRPDFEISNGITTFSGWGSTKVENCNLLFARVSTSRIDLLLDYLS